VDLIARGRSRAAPTCGFGGGVDGLDRHLVGTVRIPKLY
jgi:hypothetical protein